MSRLKESMCEAGAFVVTCECVPGRGPRGKSIDEIVEFAREAVSTRLPIHAISTTCNPGGNPAISPDILGVELEEVGIETLIHFSCANANRNTIEARATALARNGMQNLLVVSGDYPVGGYQGMAKPVYDLDSVQTLRYLKDMNNGLQVPGRKPATFDTLPQTEFFLGCAVSPFKLTESELMPQFFKLEKKIQAGADFIIPQLGYDVRKFAEILKYMKYRGIGVPLIGSVYTLSRPVARFMNKGMIHGCIVTDELLKKIEDEAEAPDKGRAARIERSAQLMAIFKGLKFQGVHVGGFGLKCADYAHIISRSQEIGDNWRDYVENFGYNRKDEFYLFPEDPDLTFDEDKLVPVESAHRPRKPVHFMMSLLVHRLVFKEDTLGYRMTQGLYRLISKSSILSRIAYFFERQIKSLLFECQECGDCALFDLAYLCPMSQCAKFQRNGPCGGSTNGMCEADEKKKCVWPKVYARYAAIRKLDKIRLDYVPPVDCSLAKTSSWENFFLGRDHTAKKLQALREAKKN